MTEPLHNLLEQHFDTAFAAPDGIKKLRELILTLAMQGKLVAQDPNDPPASELLKQIEAEKQRRYASSSSRKKGSSEKKDLDSRLSGNDSIRIKSFPPIRSDEMPYELPQGWEWVRINEICHDWGQKIPNAKFTYIDVGAIDNKLGTISPSTQILDTTDAPSRARKIVKPGTVIYSTVRPYLLNIAILEKEYDPEPIASTAFAVLHPFASLSARFIYHYLRSPIFIRYVENTQKGVAYPAINDGDFFNGLFPLSPLPEQHRIVAKIDQLMAKCDELEALRKFREEKRRAVHIAAIKQLLDTTSSFPRKRESSSSEELDLCSLSAREQTCGSDGVSAHGWNFIQQHFGELYTVKENVAELRKAILQLAVMGRLIPQDLNDPPASELLKQIEAEKQRLVKSGKIKQPKPLPPIKPEEVPYELPMEWIWIRLGNAGSFERGRSKHRPRNDKRLFENGTFPFVQTGDVSKSKLTKNQILTCNSFYNDFGLKQSRIWNKGTLCITIAANIAETGFLGMDACIPDSVVAFLGIDKSLENLVKLFIDVAKEDLEHFAPSTAQKNINLSIINEMLFPLPPLPEQHRIVAKVDQLMTLCDQLEQQIDAASTKQRELLDAVMSSVS